MELTYFYLQCFGTSVLRRFVNVCAWWYKIFVTSSRAKISGVSGTISNFLGFPSLWYNDVMTSLRPSPVTASS